MFTFQRTGKTVDGILTFSGRDGCVMELGVFALAHNQGKAFFYGNGSHVLLYANSSLVRQGKQMATFDGVMSMNNDGIGKTSFHLELFRLPTEVVEVAVFAATYSPSSGGILAQISSASLIMEFDQKKEEVNLKNLPGTFFDSNLIQAGSWVRRGEDWVFELVGKGHKGTWQQLVDFYSLKK